MKQVYPFVLLSVCFLLSGSLLAEEPASPGTQGAASPVKAQNKITLDIKGMDVVDVLKMVSARAGLNIAVGKNVSGKVTLFLKEVDLMDAFEIVLLTNDLAYERKGEIINIMTQKEYELLYGERFQDKKQAKMIQLKYAKAPDLLKALAQIKTNLGKIVIDEASNTLFIVDAPEKVKAMTDFIAQTDLPVETKVFSLNYAQADKLQTKIQELVTKGAGSLKIDERTNKIAVTDYPGKLEEIGRLIQEFDEKTPQVLIDAQIIEISPSDKFEMGVDWNFLIEKYFQARASLPINTANTLFLGTASKDPTEKGDFKAVLDILRTIGDTKVLSSPRIMALNNQEAKILVGTKDAYITSTTSQGASGTTVTSQAVNFVDVGIKLFVTPIISRDGFVTMKIKPEISSAIRTSITSENQVTQIPIVTTSEAETTVMMKDGVTLIIGGLQKDSRTKTVRKIPVLGDIPLAGFFFRSTSDELTKTQLVILLTPHIISGESTYSDFSQIPPKQGAVAKMDRGTITIEKVGSHSEDLTEYSRSVTERIVAAASFDRPEKEKGEVKLAFTLLKNGTLSGEPEVVETGNTSLIPYAVRAVKSAAPFAAFPDAAKKQKEGFTIYLSYQ